MQPSTIQLLVGDGLTMKAIWAKRVTTCEECDLDIDVGSQRLDDIERRNGHLFRIHYHWPACVLRRIQNWFEKNPPLAATSAGGRPRTLDLLPEQQKARQRLLSRLSALRNYYLASDTDGTPRLNWQGDVTTLTEKDIRRFKRFSQRFEEIRKALEPIGGLPARYDTASKAEPATGPQQGPGP